MCILRKHMILAIIPAVLLSRGPEAGAGPLSPSDFDLSVECHLIPITLRRTEHLFCL
jgi:hypothetical protein